MAHAHRDPDQTPGTCRTTRGAGFERLNLPARPEWLRGIRDDLRRWAVGAALAPEEIEVVVLCTDEALSNAVEHAYVGSDGTLDISAVRCDDPFEVTAKVTDHGHWRAPRSEAGFGGRGLAIIRRLADRVDVSTDPHGTTIQMTWSRHASPSRAEA
jgi:anti-sigma regulatory factor (Ser/Thr protein kinase)